MLATIVAFLALSFTAYSLISLFGQLTGGSPGDFWADVRSVFKPLPLLILLVANVLFVAAISLGLKVSQYALPISFAVGIIASFTYSTLFIGGVVTIAKVAGIVLILAGIYFLR